MNKEKETRSIVTLPTKDMGRRGGTLYGTKYQRGRKRKKRGGFFIDELINEVKKIRGKIKKRPQRGGILQWFVPTAAHPFDPKAVNKAYKEKDLAFQSFAKAAASAIETALQREKKR